MAHLLSGDMNFGIKFALDLQQLQLQQLLNCVNTH